MTDSCECGRSIRVKNQNKSEKILWLDVLLIVVCFPYCLTSWRLKTCERVETQGRIIWSNSAKTVLIRRLLIQTRSLGTFFALTIRSASWTQVPQNDFWGVWDQHINHSQRWGPYFCRPMRIWEYVCPIKGSWIHLGGLQSLFPFWPFNFLLSIFGECLN